MDLFGERVAGRVLQRPAGGAGGVVPERERGLEVLGVDLAFAVGERVEEREADRVRFGAGESAPAIPAGLGYRELDVGVVPQLARVLLEASRPAVRACRSRRRARAQGRCRRAGRWSAFGQQPGAAAADEQKPVRQPVGELSAGEVMAQLAG